MREFLENPYAIIALCALPLILFILFKLLELSFKSKRNKAIYSNENIVTQRKVESEKEIETKGSSITSRLIEDKIGIRSA